jgi:zinc D-Ala-D-Ala carboxypeptidase
MTDERISPHFMLSEFLRSDLATREGIDMTPTPQQLANLRRNAAGMEQVRAHLGQRRRDGVAIHVNSGLRVEALERMLCGKDFAAWCARHMKDPATAWPEYFARKQHPKGLATDFEAPDYGPPAAVCRSIAGSPIGFDQLIYEHTWTHVSWPEAARWPGARSSPSCPAARTRPASWSGRHDWYPLLMQGMWAARHRGAGAVSRIERRRDRLDEGCSGGRPRC